MESSNVRPTMLIVLGIGLLGAVFLPAMKINIISFFGTIPMEFSLRESVNALFNTGRGWAVAIAAIGVIIIVSNVLGYDSSDKDTSRRWLTGGAVLTLLFPFNLMRAMDSVVADTVEEADGMAMIDTSLAMGLIVPSVAFIVVAGLAWYASSQSTNAQTTYTPSATRYTPPPSPITNFSTNFSPIDAPTDVSRPKWMTGNGPR